MRLLLFVAAALTLTSDDALESTRDLELTVRVVDDTLVAWNPTAESELVFLQDPVTGAASSFFVPALSRAQLDIPCDIDRDLRLFACVRSDDDRIVYSEQWSLADVSVYGTVWLEVDQGAALSWIQSGAELIPVEPTSPPPPLSTLVTTTTTHVAVITPYENATGDTPPPLPYEPLPPF